MRTDDFVRVWVDGNLVLEAWSIQLATYYTVDVVLTTDSHLVKVEYFEHTGLAQIHFSFAGLSSAPPPVKTPMPTLTPAPSATPAPATAWFGEYFSIPNLRGSSAVTCLDSAIGIECGTGSLVFGVLGVDHSTDPDTIT